MINPLTGIIFGLIIYLFFKPENLLIDADTGWHLMAGQWIIDHHAVPFNNVFSYDTGNYQWYNISWLWDVLFGFIYKYTGLYGTVAATILVLILTILLVARICFYRGGGVISTAEIFITSVFTFISAALVRPHISTYLFTAITLFLCYKLKNQKRLWPLALLPFIIILWANMHGGFIVGFSIIFSFFGEMILRKSYPRPLLLIASTIACLLAVLLNPIGLEVFAGINRSLSGPMASHINEWQITEDPVNYIYTAMFLIVFAFNWRKFSLAEIILSFFWLVQSVLSFRNLPIFVIISAPALAAGLHQFVMSRPNIAEKEISYAKKFSPRSFAFVLVIFGCILTSGVWQKVIKFDPNKVPNYPVKELNFVMSNYPNNRFFNNYDIGGYVILGSNGKLKTFVDGRAETGFPNDVLQDYLKFHLREKNWPQIFDKYKINGIIISQFEDLQIDTIEKDPQWRLVFEGDKANVYVRP